MKWIVVILCIITLIFVAAVHARAGDVPEPIPDSKGSFRLHEAGPPTAASVEPPLSPALGDRSAQ